MPSCSMCGAVGASKKCSKCRVAVYCTKTCQKAHWKAHKMVCASLAQGAATEPAHTHAHAQARASQPPLSTTTATTRTATMPSVPSPDVPRFPVTSTMVPRFPVADEATARAAGLDDTGMATLRQYEARHLNLWGPRWHLSVHVSFHSVVSTLPGVLFFPN